MVDLSLLVTFAGVVLLASMAPGPDFMIITRNAARGGVRTGAASAVGIGLGAASWGAAVAVGLAGLLALWTVAFTVIKWVGAAYLVYLGVQALRSARRTGSEPTAAEGRADVVGRRAARIAFRQGLLSNLLNPKVAVFYLAIFPQFLDDAVSVPGGLELAAVGGLVALVWSLVLAYLGGVLGRVLVRAQVRRAVDAVVGTVLVALGVRVATQAT